MTEGADRQVGRSAPEARQQVEIGPHLPELQIDMPVMRPQFAAILGLTRIHDVERVDDVFVARVELFEVEPGGDREL